MRGGEEPQAGTLGVERRGLTEELERWWERTQAGRGEGGVEVKAWLWITEGE